MMNEVVVVLSVAGGGRGYKGSSVGVETAIIIQGDVRCVFDEQRGRRKWKVFVERYDDDVNYYHIRRK